MSAIKIITQRSSYLERSITFEVDGRIETVSAPASTTTFDDLLARIESEFGAASKSVGTDKTNSQPAQAAPAAPKISQTESNAVVADKPTPEKEQDSQSSKPRKKTATSDKSPV